MGDKSSPGNETQALLDEQLASIRQFRKEAAKQGQKADAGLDTFARLAGFELEFDGDKLTGFKPTDQFLQESESRERLTETATSRLQDVLEGRVEDPRARLFADDLRERQQARVEAQFGGPQNLGSTEAQRSQQRFDIERGAAIFGAGLTLQQMFENTRRGLVAERETVRTNAVNRIGAGINLGQQSTANFAAVPGQFSDQIATSATFGLQPTLGDKLLKTGASLAGAVGGAAAQGFFTKPPNFTTNFNQITQGAGRSGVSTLSSTGRPLTGSSARPVGTGYI